MGESDWKIRFHMTAHKMKLLWKSRYVKIMISVFALFLADILFYAGNSAWEREGYAANGALYLADGVNIYAFIETDSIDYGEIRDEICNGNADAVKERYENANVSKDVPDQYAAVQNILGIAEIYLGEYERAYEYFIGTIDYVNNSQMSEKEGILAVLHNNAGAVALSRRRRGMWDEHMNQAAGYCEDPYMELAVELNQVIRPEHAEKVEYGRLVGHMVRLIRKERQIKGTTGVIGYEAANYMAIRYVMCGKEKKGKRILDRYIERIPDTPEYNMLRALLFVSKSDLYRIDGEFEKAGGCLHTAIAEAGKTADRRSVIMSGYYIKHAQIYRELGDWKNEFLCVKKAMRGARYAASDWKGGVCLFMAHAYEMFDEDEQAKKYAIKSCLYYQRLGGEYDGEAISMLRNIFRRGKYDETDFHQWAEDELQKADIEDEADFR